MAEFTQPDNDIERAIAAIGTSEADDPDGEKRRKVLVALALNELVVLLAKPWEGEAAPDSSAEPMYVSDGKNTEQAMLALFTSADRALNFARECGGFQHPCTVAGPWAIGNVMENAGIMINPNQALAFRIVPEMAEALKADVATAIERARERARADSDMVS